MMQLPTALPATTLKVVGRFGNRACGDQGDQSQHEQDEDAPGINDVSLQIVQHESFLGKTPLMIERGYGLYVAFSEATQMFS
jgi:hypothetical protein